jgi:5'-nucleotidase
VSLSQGTPPDYPATAIRALHLIRQLLKRDIPRGSLWNINFPNTHPEGPRGVVFTSMGVRRHSDTVEKRIDPRGRPYYWSGLDPMKNHQLDAGSDVKAIHDGNVSITPLHFDLTESQMLASIQSPPFTL